MSTPTGMACDEAVAQIGLDNSAPENEEFTEQDFRRLRRVYRENRIHPDLTPLEAYEISVTRWARTSPARMARHCSDLLSIAANPVMLNEALGDLEERHGRAVFKKTVFQKDGCWDELRYLESLIHQGRFRRGRYKKVLIAKPGSDQYRTIEVSPAATRIVSRSLSNILVPLLDAGLSRLAIGCRPGRSVFDGIAIAERLYADGFTHWVTCDLRDAYGKVPRKRLRDVLNSRLHQSSVIGLIDEVLDSTRRRGIPQGISISPLMLNLYLDHMLDRWWATHFPNTALVRYLDDICVFSRTADEARKSYDALDKRMRENGMAVKENANQAVRAIDAGEDAQWLGFKIRSVDGELCYGITEKSWQRLRLKFREQKILADKGIPASERDLLSIATGRMREKAPAIGERGIAAAAKRIRDTAIEEGINLSGFTDQSAVRAWKGGRRAWSAARERVPQWLAQRAGASS